MQDSPSPRSHVSHTATRGPYRRPLTWRGVVATAMLALGLVAVVVALSAPVAALATAVTAVVVAAAVSTARRLEAIDAAPVRRLVARLAGCVTPA